MKEMLQSLNHLCCPPLDSLQELHVSLVLRGQGEFVWKEAKPTNLGRNIRNKLSLAGGQITGLSHS